MIGPQFDDIAALSGGAKSKTSKDSSLEAVPDQCFGNIIVLQNLQAPPPFVGNIIVFRAV
jgi:hypothetical protein